MILWSQTKDELFIKIKLFNVENCEITFEMRKIHFKSISNNVQYDFSLNLSKNIDKSNSQYNIFPSYVDIKMLKNEKEIWNSLLEDKSIRVVVDWDRFIDEDDDSEDKAYDNDYNESL